MTAGRPAPVLPPAGAPGPVEVPRLADGVELLGEYKDSGYSQPPSLVRRPDGQVIQVSALLYQVVCRIDGSRGPAAIAELASADLGRTLSADQVRYLITAKLLPLGIVADGNAPAAAPTANPLLALRARGTLLPERAANAAGALLTPLFRGPVIVAVLATLAALDWWLFAVHGLGGGLQQVLRDPVDLLVVLGLSLVSAMFHECGHAAGCRYGGARTGKIGVGIYMVWPAFFTNVTDSYRLSRAGRLRTDLGGLYFNAIFMLALAGIYAATSSEVLLLVIAVTHLEMLEQLLPFARFDGYFILSDLVGVPDLFARVVPILRSALPGAAAGPARHRPAAPRPDRGDRLGGLRHPAARGRLRVPPAVPAPGRPGAVALGERAGPPPGRRSDRSPLRHGCGRRVRRRVGGPVVRGVALPSGRAGAADGCPGPALVRWPSGPPPPGRRGRPGGPGGAGRLLGPARPVPWLVARRTTTSAWPCPGAIRTCTRARQGRAEAARYTVSAKAGLRRVRQAAR